ncbi:DUF3850 domain-containing protein [Bacteroides sp.]|uniref:DUF3850 domain-containing protein n=1 Tax=Bacteroides sp. TaxID=29523 RepID=UPI002FCC1FFD
MNKHQIYELKIDPQFFEGVINKSKAFELRKDDCPYSVGDTLHLLEYNAETGKYTGRSCLSKVDYILRDYPGLLPGYCVMSISGCVVRVEPNYYYHRHMGSYKLYQRNHDGTSNKIDQHWDEEVIRKQCYELNGWTYKPKTKRS